MLYFQVFEDVPFLSNTHFFTCIRFLVTCTTQNREYNNHNLLGSDLNPPFTLVKSWPYNYMIYMMSTFVPKREASSHSLTVWLHNRSATHTQSFSSIAIPRVSLLHALTSVSSTLQAHHSHTSPSHDLSASDIMPMLPHCPTYKWREGAVEEDDSGG